MRDYKRPASTEARPSGRKARVLIRSVLALAAAVGLLWAASATFKKTPTTNVASPVKPEPAPTKPRSAFIEQILPAPLRGEIDKVAPKPKAVNEAPAKKKKKPKRPPETPERDYDFYKLLPDMEVKIESEQTVSANPATLAPTLSANPDAAEGAAPVDAAEDKAPQIP